MQKEIYFNYNGHEYDLDFVHPTLNNMYVVYDKVSGLNLSQVIVCKNDYVAIKGFEQFVLERKKDNRDYSIFILQRLGTINYESKKIFPNNEEEFNGFVCDSNLDFDEYFTQANTFLAANSED